MGETPAARARKDCGTFQEDNIMQIGPGMRFGSAVVPFRGEGGTVPKVGNPLVQPPVGVAAAAVAVVIVIVLEAALLRLLLLL